MRRSRLKKLPIVFLCIFFIVFTFTSQTSARSLSIDDVHIRALITPDGNLLINEMFTYTFDGSYKNVRRSVHKAHHNGVKEFEAYELMNPNASLEAIDKNDMRQLDVHPNDNHYTANLAVKNESKKVVYVYILENAVRSYETYSDVTVPFFGTDSNHDTDIQNVTIDFVFPDKLNSNTYHAFLHDEEGYVVQKTEEVVRFFTPISKMRRLTEPRILFPSSIMTGQQKGKEPISLEKALQQEEKAGISVNAISDTQEIFTHFLFLLSGLFIIAAGCLLLLPQRRLRSHARPEDLLKYDPFYLYIIDRVAVKDPYALLAGVYSLVEKGCVTVRKASTLTRFQRDPGAPKNTLAFTFHPSTTPLSESEKGLLDWLFTRKQKLGQRFFSLNNIYGATKKEKEAKEINGYFRKRIKHLHQEDNWFRQVLLELKERQLISGWLYPISTRILIALVLILTTYTYFIKASSGFGIILYLIVSVFLLRNAWTSLIRKQVLAFFFVTMITGWIFVEIEFILPFTLFICAMIIFYLTVPRFILSREAAEVRAEIRHFRKMIRKEGIPSSIDESKLDKWMIRAVLLNVKRFELDMNQFKKPMDEFILIAPMSALVFNGEDPSSYLLKTWKWSMPFVMRPSVNKSSGKRNNSDSGGDGFSSGGDSGGDGGGAGAD